VIGVVVSRADSASEHVGEHLLAEADWTERTDDSWTDAEGGGTVYRTDDVELRFFDAWHLVLKNVTGVFDGPSLVVFASRHSGETGPLLTAHFTGNFGAAEFGGADRTLARACPNAQKRALAVLAEHAPPGYEVSAECTHHGPTAVDAPSLFVELGSEAEQWTDPAGARAVARAILALGDVAPDREKQLAWFGGNHYAPRPTRLVRETDWAVGHVAADWCLDDLGRPEAHADVVDQAFERSAATHAVVAAGDPALERVIADLGYRAVSETWVRQTDGVALPLVAALEDALCPVEEGLRFGEPARFQTSGDGFDVATLPSDLLAEATGIDREAVAAAAAETALAYETAEGGSLVAGQAAFVDAAAAGAFLDRLLELLRRKHDEVTLADGTVVARRTAFDPALAADRGVPEGPAFGKLAGGDPVTVDGETVRPADVSTERVARFAVGSLTD